MPGQDIQRGGGPQIAEDTNRNSVCFKSSTEELQWTNSSGTVYTGVDLSNTQTITGVKTFTGVPKMTTVNDTAGINRLLLNATAKTIVDGSATSLFDVACANNTNAGGMVFYFVQATDGTDYQCMSGMVAYGMVNKAGTNTLTITDVTGNNAKAVSSGTLTLAWTFVTGTAKGTVKLQPTGSLTETAPYNVTYSVFPLIGAVTIL